MATVTNKTSRRREENNHLTLPARSFILQQNYFSEILRRKRRITPNPQFLLAAAVSNVLLVWDLQPGTPKLRSACDEGRQRWRKSLVTVNKLGSEISGKIKKVIRRGVDGGHKKLKSVSGRKIVMQLKAMVAPAVDRRRGSSMSEAA
ncbi:hypothetical protein LINGRAHAP2_LOCUS28652, partial [Linum grandiflorum]